MKLLNLFAYTGGASIAAAAAGASVTHVDASKGMVTWAKENAKASGLAEAPIRWIVDDCMKFVEREIRRGNRYSTPSSWIRPLWARPEGRDLEDGGLHPRLPPAVRAAIVRRPLFFLLNSYTTGLAPAVLTYLLSSELMRFGGHVDSQEIGLPVTSSGLVLPCGASGRWER